MSHLDELFEKSFQEKLQLLEQEWVEFRAPKEDWTESEVYQKMLIKLRGERDGMIEKKVHNDNGQTIAVLRNDYKATLFGWFSIRNKKYRKDPVYHFIQEIYLDLRSSRLRSYESGNHDLIDWDIDFFYLSDEDVVVQLAQYEAILKFIEKLESVIANKKKVTSFAEEVRNLFAASQHNEALELLIKHLGNVSPLLSDEVIILKSRYTEVQNKFRKAIISYAEESTEVTRITNSALAILRDFERENP